MYTVKFTASYKKSYKLMIKKRMPPQPPDTDVRKASQGRSIYVLNGEKNQNSIEKIGACC